MAVPLCKIVACKRPDFNRAFGSGKTTGETLVKKRDGIFERIIFTPENIAKCGWASTQRSRTAPWLAALHLNLSTLSAARIHAACSALKQTIAQNADGMMG